MAELLTTVYLPSKGKLNVDEPAYAGPIDLDMMGFEQEKMIFGSNSEGAIDKMLNSVIKTEGISIDKMAPQDKHFLLVKERIHSYGPDYHITYECPHCGKEEEHVINMNDIPVLELPDDFIEPIECTLPLSGTKLGLRLLRNSDKKAIDNEIRMKAEKLKLNPSEMRYELRKVKAIVTIDGKEPSLGERQALVRGLKGRDLAYFDHVLNKIQFGFSSTVLTTCTSCNGEFEVPFVLTSEFFRPRFD